MSSMALAVCLLFDVNGDRTIRRLWARLEARGVPTPLTHTHGHHRPHLSLAVARTWDLAAIREAVAQLPAGDQLTIPFQGTLAFPRGRAALAAAAGADLVRRQEAVARAVLATGADLHHHYAPGRWVPHVSVATGGSANRLPLIATMVNDSLPLVVETTHAGLVDSSTGELWPLPSLP